MRETILSAIARQKLVVILRGLPHEKLVGVLDALTAGGVQLVEITFAADSRISDTRQRENRRSSSGRRRR